MGIVNKKNNYIRVLALIICGLFCANLSAQDWLQQPVKIDNSERSLGATLLALGKAANVGIAFDSKWEALDNSFRFTAQPLNLEEALKQCLQGTGLGFNTKNKRIIIYVIGEESHRISGYLEDASSGERLVAATIWDPVSGKGTLTNNYGFFSFENKPGTYTLHFSYLGYQVQKQVVQLYKDLQLNVQLSPSLSLPEVIVTNDIDSSAASASKYISQLLISNNQLRSIPTLGGEADIFAYLHQYTGVQRGADGLGGLFVRGGSSDQNLVLLDDIPIFQPSHSLGLFSVINPMLIRSARFYQDGFPARYSGRLSSVLDIRTKEGNTHQKVIEAEVNTFTSKLLLEIPLQENKSSLLIAGRRTHIDPWLRAYSSQQKFIDLEEGETNYYFYDINVKFHQKLSEQDRFFVSLYHGRDRYENTTISEYEFIDEFDIEGTQYNDIFQDLSWSNTVGALRWNHLFSNQLFSNTTLTYSSYSYLSQNDWFSEEIIQVDTIDYVDYSRFQSIIRDFRFKMDFDYYASDQHHWQWGVTSLFRQFNPGALEIQILEDSTRRDEITSSIEAYFVKPSYSASEWSLYAEDEITLATNWTLHAGVHLTAFLNQQNYHIALQPRSQLRYQPSKTFAAHFSIGRMSQFIHLLTFSGASLPTDLWVPATPELGPQQAWQGTLGVQWEINPHWSVSGNAYYKYMDGLLQYIDEAQLPNLEENVGDFWESQVSQGKGYSYGGEWVIKRNGSKSNLGLAYVYQQSRRQFPDINQGDVFPFSFERPHKITFNFQQKISKQLHFKLHWEYSSGRPITLVSSEFRFQPLDNFLFPYNEQLSSINGFRLPAYHRLDFTLNWDFIGTDKFSHSFQLGLYNAYNRRNAYFAYFYEEEYFLADSGINTQNSLPLLPTIGYRMRIEK